MHSIIRIELFEKDRINSLSSFSKSKNFNLKFKAIQIQSSLMVNDLKLLMYIFNRHNLYFYRIFFIHVKENDENPNYECIIFQNSITNPIYISKKDLKTYLWIENSDNLKAIHPNFKSIFNKNIQIKQTNNNMQELELAIVENILSSKNLISYKVFDIILSNTLSTHNNHNNFNINKHSENLKVEELLNDNGNQPNYEYSEEIKLSNTDIEKYIQKNKLLTNEQMKSFNEYFYKIENRKPSLLEAHFFAQSWSEHCCHNIFSYQIDDITEGLYRHYIKRATNEIIAKKDLCISVFSDNAGSFIFDDKYSIAVKVETHNSPCVLSPFNGSITGILGVNRDIIGFGMGAKPISNTFCFCLPDLNFHRNNKKQDGSKRVVPNDTKELLDGIALGINQGGNLSGIPTIHGSLHFNKGYRGKPLVFVGTIGLIPLEINGKPSHKKQVEDGDYIVILGSKTGRDGVHGATFSSGGMDNCTNNISIPNGDPYTQKITSDLIIKKALQLGLYNAITDIGAGGFSSSVGEMGEKGFHVNLNNVITKTSTEHRNLSGWEIWISETQERMTLSVPKKNIESLKSLAETHGVTMYIIGTFNNSGRAIIEFNNETICNISLNFLKNGNPKLTLSTEGAILREYNNDDDNNCPYRSTISGINIDLIDILKNENTCSNKFLFEQYDHEVLSMSALKPLQGINRVNGDTSVIRPILDSNKGLATSHSLCRIPKQLKAYDKVARAIDNTIRKLIITGANPDKITLLDNFCWADPYNKERLLQLKQACNACYDISTFFGTPFISGKDSMFNQRTIIDNDNNIQNIYNDSTLLITATGIIEDINNIVSLDNKYNNDDIYAIGAFTSNIFDIKQHKQIYSKYYQCLIHGYISSAISINEELPNADILALAKKSISSGLGVKCDFSTLYDFNNMPLIFVTVRKEVSDQFIKIIGHKTAIKIGAVCDNNTFSISFKDGSIIQYNLNNLIESYHIDNNINNFV